MKFNKSLLFITLSSILYSPSFYATTKHSPTNSLITNVLTSKSISKDLNFLTTVIGGRPTGSSALDSAMQWSLKRFVAEGFTHAYLDAYTAPLNWLPNIEIGEMNSVTPVSSPQTLRVAALPFSPSTPDTGLEAPVYAISSTNVNEIMDHANQIKGHWLLVATNPMGTVEDLFNEYLATPPIFTAAQKVGAIGVLWMSNRNERLLYRHNAALNGSLAPLPAALIEREGAQNMIQLLESQHPVTFKATLKNIIQKNPENYNVVAEIKGYEKPDEVIILGAHLDSWDLGQGALDNGCNAVMVLDVARSIMALQQHGFKPRRSIRFMLYSGEESGLYGSWFDVKNHPQKLDKIKAVIIFDTGSGRTMGFSLGGRSDMQLLVDNALEPVNQLGPFTQTSDAFYGTDNFDYLLKGIPTLVANQDPVPYLPSYHAESDTLDKVDFAQLRNNTVITSVLTWNLANTDLPFPARQSTEEIKELLISTGLKEQMEIYNIWESFENGQR